MKRVVEEAPAITGAAVPSRRVGIRFVGNALFVLFVLIAAVAGAVCGLAFVYSTDLPQVTELEHYRPSTITQLYDDQNRAVGQFSLQRRVIDSYGDFPKVLRDALISTEDKEFENHFGVDVWRVFGAAWHDVVLESRAQGASTLTMQLARNLFLSPDRNFRRKMQEVMLSIQIERRFTKPQIFTLYANQIYLGHGVYGFEAGANYYFSKKAKELTLDEAAVLAGLPKAPNYYSPINNPERAIRRRNLVINNMLEDGKITAAEAERAKSAPLVLKLQAEPNDIAPYFVEEIRQYLEKKYGAEEVHEAGLRVYTGLNLEMQHAAQQSLRDGLAAYERRHGWKGNLLNIIANGDSLATYHNVDWDGAIEPGSYVHALVTVVEPMAATVKFGNYEARLGPEEIKWTHHKSPQEFLSVGDIVYVKVDDLNGAASRVSLEQESGVEGALMALDNSTGDVKAMVGGRDFEQSKFNRATQALRQVGSSFKPYIYTAAIDRGAHPRRHRAGCAHHFQHPVRPIHATQLRRQVRRRHHLPPRAGGVAERPGPEGDGAGRRDQDGDRLRAQVRHHLAAAAYLPVALGAADITLAEQTAAFTTFPNDGVRVVPRYIRKVTDYDGRVLEENYPEVRDVISARTARIMTSMLREVILHGTGYQARALNHPLGGKTGTTNDFTDAWFVGFSPSLTCGVWVGYDEKITLGDKETGARAALPIWIDFMRVALEGRESEDFAAPPPEVHSAVAEKLTTPDAGDSEAH